ncbi:fibrous sheath CABYR-binding protein-like isoform X2 [Diachasmimorpha longicaudata]|uniref:fibrous sheath CABYR-binding protein-like isoform X2 n=1 Tax=Diachasmimorpha longicaudata TaxID=58733 RepID=UPI0030B8E478
MSSATFAGNSDASGTPGFCPAPPPPPPPPGVGQVPAMRINTVETPISRRPLPSANDPYEPPAAIQNAMMTKDKKPFTYTPGMGGKLDLSQIRSPRMARRVAKNANDEGIEGPPKSPLAAEQPRPVSTVGNLYVQPQVAVPVFPTNTPPGPQVTRPHQVNRTISNAGEMNQEPPRPTVKIEPRTSQPSTPDTPTSPTQVNLNKAPTPWMQKNVRDKQQEELPEWVRRSNGNGSSTHSPPQSPPGVVSFVPQSPAPQPQRVMTQMRPAQTQPAERVIPLSVEDRPSVFSIKNDPGASGHHQLKQTPPHHQSRWYAPQNSQNQPPAPRPVSSPPGPQPQSGGTFIVPMTVEGTTRSLPVNSQYQQPARAEYTQPAPNQMRGNFQQRASAPISPQSESGPVQSRSFRVLQKITDTDDDDMDSEQMRKLQLTEDDKLLMNKFKEQVDGDTYLHQEEDPRYRGAAIPSRAFRYLQNMTDDGVNTNEEPQLNVPASEQQVPEPKKYTGSAIPSRSFRILQAMTTPESMEISQSLDNWVNVETAEVSKTDDDETSDCDWSGKIKATSKTREDDSLKAMEGPGDQSVNINADHNVNDDHSDASESSSSAENCPSGDVTSDSDSSTSPGESESYLAYSTGFNDPGILDIKKCEGIASVEGHSSTDCETAEEDEGEEREGEELKPEVAQENENRDEEQKDDEIHKKDGTDEINPKENLNETKNNSNQDELPLTVSVRLPLRFRISVTTNEEEEKRASADGNAMESAANFEENTPVIEANTTVDFTLRRKGSTRPKSWFPEKSIDEFWASETILKKESLSPVSFTARSVKEDDQDLKKSQGDEEKPEDERQSVPQFELTVDESHKHEEELTDEGSKNKYLLTVQNSRDETDEEDSGVTSDLSRIISEVDTDSESTPARKTSAYKRTQTHSRLFRLISGDSVLAEDDEDLPEDKSMEKHHLELPGRKSSAFSYDHSNDSSGLTSPDFSPIFETSWRRFQESVSNGAVDSAGKDSYFRTWKEAKTQNPQNFVASTPGVIFNIPAWSYKSKVLCPRVRSIKNIPDCIRKPNKYDRC